MVSLVFLATVLVLQVPTAPNTCQQVLATVATQATRQQKLVQFYDTKLAERQDTMSTAERRSLESRRAVVVLRGETIASCQATLTTLCRAPGQLLTQEEIPCP